MRLSVIAILVVLLSSATLFSNVATKVTNTRVMVNEALSSVGQCADGSSPVQCFANPCATATCPRHPHAVCRANYCGGCNAQFFAANGDRVSCKQCPLRKCTVCPSGRYGKDKDGCQNCVCLPALPSVPPTPTIQCPLRKCVACPSGQYGKDSNGCQTCECLPESTQAPQVALTQAPCPLRKCVACPSGRYGRDANGCQTCECLLGTSAPVTPLPIVATPLPIVATPEPAACADGSLPVQCFVDPCLGASCSAFPTAECRANYCGGCNAEFFNNGGEKLDCVRGVPADCGFFKCRPCPEGQSFVKDSRGCDSCTCAADDSTGGSVVVGGSAVDSSSPIDTGFAVDAGSASASVDAESAIVDAASAGVALEGTSKPECGLACDIHCEHGNVLDENGCPTCFCQSPPSDSELKPEPESNPTSELEPGSQAQSECSNAVCMIYCEHGNVADENGCPTCQCKPVPEPEPTPVCDGPMCAIFCPNGNVKDSRGCPTCRCNQSPVLTQMQFPISPTGGFLVANIQTFPTRPLSSYSTLPTAMPVEQPMVISQSDQSVGFAVVQSDERITTAPAETRSERNLATSTETTSTPERTTSTPEGATSAETRSERSTTTPAPERFVATRPLPTTAEPLRATIVPTHARAPNSRCGPACRIVCRHGNVVDERGCPTCRCKSTAGG